MSEDMSCSCVNDLDRLLAKENGKLSMTTILRGNVLFSRPVLVVQKIAHRSKKPPYVFCSFCPFCGARYPNAVHADNVTPLPDLSGGADA